MEELRINTADRSKNSVPDEPQKSDKSTLRELSSVIGILVSASLIAFVLTVFIFQSYVVDGPSMEKTLFNQDRLIVWKASKSWTNLFNKVYVPDRYSIVVFHQNTSSGPSDKQLIKRAIGLPGDRVVVKDGLVTIYNDENPGGFFPDRIGPEANVIGRTTGNIDYTVRPGEIFVLGDNRDNSLDSRAFGAVKSESIVGTLAVRIFPFNNVDKF